MNRLIIYDSFFGNTEKIAQAIGHALGAPEEIQALRVGETAIVGLPGEIFVEIGLEIKQRSPFPRTLVGELANDNPGYIPTPKAFEEGSYEVYTTPASPETAPSMIESALQLLEGISG